jgi:hypothetical protein
VTSPAKVGASRLIDMPKRLSSAMRIGKTGSANGGTISTDPGSDNGGTGSASALADTSTPDNRGRLT